MSRVKDNIDFLRFLASASSVKQRQNLLRNTTQDQVLAIAEIVINVLKGNVEIDSSTLDILKKYRKPLRKLASLGSSKIALNNRRECVVKAGKALSALLKGLDIIKQ